MAGNDRVVRVCYPDEGLVHLPVGDAERPEQRPVRGTLVAFLYRLTPHGNPRRRVHAQGEKRIPVGRGGGAGREVFPRGEGSSSPHLRTHDVSVLQVTRTVSVKQTWTRISGGYRHALPPPPRGGGGGRRPGGVGVIDFPDRWRQGRGASPPPREPPPQVAILPRSSVPGLSSLQPLCSSQRDLSSGVAGAEREDTPFRAGEFTQC